MNIAAIVIIGTICLVLGATLLIPGLWLARRKLKTLPKQSARAQRITKFGLVYYAVFVSILMVALSSKYFFPEVIFWVRLGVGLIVLAAVFLVGLLADSLGLRLFESPEDETRT